MRFLINTLISALIIATFTEVSRRSSFLAAFLISLPLTSVIALSIVYFESQDPEKVARLSIDIFWLVIPSLVFFLVLPVLLKSGWKYWLAMPASCAVMIAVYTACTFLFKKS